MKPNFWISSSQAEELLKKQLVTWPLAKTNYEAYTKIRVNTFTVNGVSIQVQFNPHRKRSSTAQSNTQPVDAGKCFLCPNNLPVEQERLPFGRDYLVLCNPYPVFPEHFTIPTRSHVDQLIKNRYGDFLELAKRLDAFTIFYNGPKSGASAPDHAHFQAVTPDFMPIDRELSPLPAAFCRLVYQEPFGSIHTVTGYMRNGFIIKAQKKETAEKLFFRTIQALPVDENETEPKMNIFGYYRNEEWLTIIIPRKTHRPRQFYADGEEQLRISPGAADMGGVLITVRTEDFEKINEILLEDIYTQVCYSDVEIMDFSRKIKR